MALFRDVGIAAAKEDETKRWLLVLALGITLGAATAASDVAAGGLQQDGLARAVSMILNAGSVWLGLAVLCGWIVARPRSGAVAGVVGLLAAVVAYYAYGVLFGDRVQGGLAGISGMMRMWALLAVVAGPFLGAAGGLIRRGGRIGVVAALIVPVGVIVEMVVARRLGEGTFAVDPALAWAQASMVVVAAVAVAIIVINGVRTSPMERARSSS